MVQSSLHITTRMNNSIPRAIPFLGCLLARLPACSPFFLPGFQLNSQSKAETTASIYQPRKHTQSPSHSPSNPKIPQHEAQPLFVFSTTNQTHPPTGSSTRTKPKANQNINTHTHTHRGTRAPKTLTLTSPSTPALPLRLNRKETNTRQDDPTSSYTLL
jgi:hypothetical protein